MKNAKNNFIYKPIENYTSGHNRVIINIDSMNIKTLSVIIPTYNEAATINKILKKVCDVELINNIKKEIIVINDCSIDSTKQIVNDFIDKNKKFNIRLIEQKVNQGKGAALHCGIKDATGDAIIVQDADLEYDPEDYNILLRPMVDGVADVVYGSRFLGGGPHRVVYYWHYLGNRFLTTFSNMITDLNLTDMEVCYKMFRKEVIQNITICESRFGFEPEITAKVAQNKNWRVYEVPISYYGRNYDEGKKIGWKDGVRAIWCIVKYRFVK